MKLRWQTIRHEMLLQRYRWQAALCASKLQAAICFVEEIWR